MILNMACTQQTLSNKSYFIYVNGMPFMWIKNKHSFHVDIDVTNEYAISVESFPDDIDDELKRFIEKNHISDNLGRSDEREKVLLEYDIQIFITLLKKARDTLKPGERKTLQIPGFLLYENILNEKLEPACKSGIPPNTFCHVRIDDNNEANIDMVQVC